MGAFLSRRHRDGLRGAQVKELVRGIKSGLKHESEDVYRVDVVPFGD
jgi:hypothetical protein